MRILFVVPPLTGHVNPTAAVGAELAARGHEVAWAGHPEALAPLLPAGARVFPATGLRAAPGAGGSGAGGDEEPWRVLRGAAALKFFWEDFVIPLAEGMLSDVLTAIGAYQPDVIVSDQQALAGAAAARLTGTPWVTSATTPAELLSPLSGLPRVEEWISDQITAFQLASGIADPVDLRFSDQLILVFTTEALMGAGADFPGGAFPSHWAFTGPALARRPDRGSFDWEWLDPERRHVLVSLGTLNGPAGTRFYRVVTEALADRGDELQAVIVGPAPDGTAPDGPAPGHLRFADHVPQLALLPHLDAVVCHGGHNTVCESLAHGLPLVVAPIRDDQPIVAQQVANAGAGIRVRFGRVRPAELATAVEAVLSQPSYRNAAARIRDSFTDAGGARSAADYLEKLL